VREDFVQGSTQFNHAAFRSGADSSSRETKNRSRSDVVSQNNSSSGAPEKSAVGEHDATASLAPEGSARTISFQPASLPTPTPAASTTLDTAQSAAQSVAHPAAVVLPQPSRDTAEGAAQPQPQLPSSPLSDPHRMVDSGQLRVSENNSELKVSVQLPELGKIEVRAVTSHDVTTAHLTASHGDALRVLSADRTGLEQALKSRDVILGSLDSQTQRHSGGQQRQENAPSSAPSSAGTSSTVARAATSATEETARVGFLPDYSSISVRA
jgi:flagellar hook-length control protein FliK